MFGFNKTKNTGIDTPKVSIENQVEPETAKYATKDFVEKVENTINVSRTDTEAKIEQRRHNILPGKRNF